MARNYHGRSQRQYKRDRFGRFTSYGSGSGKVIPPLRFEPGPGDRTTGRKKVAGVGNRHIFTGSPGRRVSPLKVSNTWTSGFEKSGMRDTTGQALPSVAQYQKKRASKAQLALRSTGTLVPVPVGRIPALVGDKDVAIRSNGSSSRGLALAGGAIAATALAGYAIKKRRNNKKKRSS